MNQKGYYDLDEPGSYNIWISDWIKLYLEARLMYVSQQEWAKWKLLLTRARELGYKFTNWPERSGEINQGRIVGNILESLKTLFLHVFTDVQYITMCVTRDVHNSNWSSGWQQQINSSHAKESSTSCFQQHKTVKLLHKNLDYCENSKGKWPQKRTPLP